MNVLVSAVSDAAGISGVQRHALNLIRALETCLDIDEVHVVVGPWQDAMHEQLSASTGPRLQVHLADLVRGALSRNVWHYWALPKLAAQLLVDLVHFTYPAPINAAGLICRSVVTLHDLYPYQIPSNFGMPRVLLNRWFLRQCLRSADGIACVSDYTATELARYLDAEVAAKTVRIYNCVDAPNPASQLRGIEELIGTPFLLCIAQHRRNKNLNFLLRVFERLRREARLDPRTRLIIVGMPGPDTHNVLRLLGKLRLRAHVRLIQGLSNEQLQWCLAHCDALLAPSLTEGFGLPVVEALQAGCRVVCSDIPAFREFGGEDCEFVRLEKTSAVDLFADAIERSLARIKPAPICFPQLAPGVIGREYFGLYHRVINRHWFNVEERRPQQIRDAVERRLLCDVKKSGM